MFRHFETVVPIFILLPATHSDLKRLQNFDKRSSSIRDIRAIFGLSWPRLQDLET